MLGLFVRISNEIADRNERGAALVEYGMLLLLVGLVSVAILTIFGDTLADTFGLANDTLENSPALNGGGN